MSWSWNPDASHPARVAGVYAKTGLPIVPVLPWMMTSNVVPMARVAGPTIDPPVNLLAAALIVSATVVIDSLYVPITFPRLGSPL